MATNLHPIKMMQFFFENLRLCQHHTRVSTTLEAIASKMASEMNEIMSLKAYYIYYILRTFISEGTDTYIKKCVHVCVRINMNSACFGRLGEVFDVVSVFSVTASSRCLAQQVPEGVYRDRDVYLRQFLKEYPFVQNSVWKQMAATVSTVPLVIHHTHYRGHCMHWRKRALHWILGTNLSSVLWCLDNSDRSSTISDVTGWCANERTYTPYVTAVLHSVLKV